MSQDPYQEMLDDPGLPFDVRWPLVEEIDRTNRRFGIYSRFLADWSGWVRGEALEGASVLEVGSGSGGLSCEMRDWGRARGVTLDMHLYDAQEDVLRESLKRFEGGDLPRTHVATGEHLAAFPDRTFDFVISLHVIHHIQPFDVAVDALVEMLRIARRGVFVIDLENKPGAVPFTRVWNRLTGVSRALSSDGVKSIRRAHDPRRLRDALCDEPGTGDYRVELKRYPIVPYWRLQARRLR